MEIPQLTEFQYRNLVRSANSDNTLFALLTPADGDTPQQREHFERYLAETEKLISHGLAEDVSEKFKESIALSREQNKRGYRVFTLTELALKMFWECGDRPVN